MRTPLRSPWKTACKKKETKRVFSTEEKLSLVSQLRDRATTAKKLSQRYGYKPQYYRNLVDKYKKNGTLKSSGGRRSLLSQMDLDELDRQLEGNKLAMATEDFVATIGSMASNTRAITHPGDNKAKLPKGGKKISVSVRTLGRIKKKLDIRDGNAETWTDARYKACCDKRNAVAFAVGCSIMVPSSHRALILNSDGTSVNVGAILNQKKKWCTKDHGE